MISGGGPHCLVSALATGLEPLAGHKGLITVNSL